MPKRLAAPARRDSDRTRGADPSDPVARSLAKVWLHRPAAMLHAGETPSAPHYKVIASVPQGQLDDARTASVVADITNAILAAEEGATTRTHYESGSLATRFPTATGAPADGWSVLRTSRAPCCVTATRGVTTPSNAWLGATSRSRSPPVTDLAVGASHPAGNEPVAWRLPGGDRHAPSALENSRAG